MESHSKEPRKVLEVIVSRVNCRLMTIDDSADEEVGARTLNALTTTQIIERRRARMLYDCGRQLVEAR